MPSKNRIGFVIASLLIIPSLLGHAQGATTGTGTVSADVGQLVEITVTDGTIAAHAEFTPVSGSDAVKFSTADSLRFSNAKSNVQSLFNYAVDVSFLRDADGSTSTSTLTYQGTTVTLSDLVYLSQSAAGDFLPASLVTGSDLTSEGDTGWTNHAGCAAVTYQGTFTVPYYSNAGAAQSALTRYYRVCDSGTEIYVASSRDVSSADVAYVHTMTSAGASATAANYEVAIGGQDYVFHSAASATTVTLRQGQHVALGTSAVTSDVYALVKIPDGFPAGVLTATITATVSDVVS